MGFWAQISLEVVELWETAGVGTLGNLFHYGVLIPFDQLMEHTELPSGHFAKVKG